MSVTIYDVAKKVGVSTATVSKVINNTGSISEKTKKKVLKAMEELQFQPSMIASALSGKSTYTIGLLIPDLSNPIFSEYARYVEDRGQELGFSVVMCNTDMDQDKEARYISLLKQKRVDGLIIAAKFENVALLKDLIKDDHIPVALIAQDIPELPVDSVTVDDYLSGYQVTEYLLSLGHKRIGILAEDAARSGEERVRGYRQALIDAGLEYDSNLILECKPTLDCAQVCAEELLKLPHRPTAIFGSNDLLAIGAMQAARQRGLSIPNDLSVIGFDNSIMSRIVEPPLSTVQQPSQDIGRQVMDLLVGKIEGKRKLRQRIVLLPELIIRQSTAQISYD